MDLIANVPKDIADLVPGFLRNCQKDIDLLSAALIASDLGEVEHLGERMYAVGNPYGFRQITTFGRQLREACPAKDILTIQSVINQYREYLLRVKITYVAAPLLRRKWEREVNNSERTRIPKKVAAKKVNRRIP
jgi:hypothetical protein